MVGAALLLLRGTRHAHIRSLSLSTGEGAIIDRDHLGRCGCWDVFDAVVCSYVFCGGVVGSALG